MFKNITQYLRHNLKNGKAIIILLTAVMLICGPIPLFMELSNRIDRFDVRSGVEKVEYARIIEKNLLRAFDMDNQYYSILLSIIAAVAGLVLAYILFFHFRKKNSCDFFLSLPLTRTEGYVSNFISGVLYYVIPMLITSVVTIVGLNIMGSWRFVNITKLLFMTQDNNGMLAMLGNNLVFFLLFFSIGTVAVLLSSNGINALAVYGTVNFYPIVFMILLLFSAEIFNNDISDFSETIVIDMLPITPIVRCLAFEALAPTAWMYISYIIAAIGISVLGCWLCNIRPAESWSSAIIYRPVRLCLQYMYCFIVAFAGGLFFYAVSDRSLLNIVMGSIIGLVVAFMVLNIIFERDVKAIFKKPIRLLWSALVFVIIFVVIVIDVFGIFRYREPKQGDVDYALVTLNRSIVSNNFYLSGDQYLSKLETPEAKQAAIKLYTYLHEDLRGEYDGFGSLMPQPENSFDDQVYIYLGNSNNVELKLMRNGKNIRPLKSSYFEKDERLYELYKAVYDAEGYVDPTITVLENMELIYAKLRVLTRSDEDNMGGIRNGDALEELRLALIKDYKNASFEDLQDTTFLSLELMYNLESTIYEATEQTYPVVVDSTSYSDIDYGISYQRDIRIAIPTSFENTLDLLQKYTDLEASEEYIDALADGIYEIVVMTYSDDGGVDQVSVKDKQQIKSLLKDSYLEINRTMAFPKHGVLMKVFFEDITEHYTEEYIEEYTEKYGGDIKELREGAAQTLFFKRTSELY